VLHRAHPQDAAVVAQRAVVEDRVHAGLHDARPAERTDLAGGEEAVPLRAQSAPEEAEVLGKGGREQRRVVAQGALGDREGVLDQLAGEGRIQLLDRHQVARRAHLPGELDDLEALICQPGVLGQPLRYEATWRAWPTWSSQAGALVPLARAAPGAHGVSSLGLRRR